MEKQQHSNWPNQRKIRYRTKNCTNSPRTTSTSTISLQRTEQCVETKKHKISDICKKFLANQSLENDRITKIDTHINTNNEEIVIIDNNDEVVIEQSNTRKRRTARNNTNKKQKTK